LINLFVAGNARVPRGWSGECGSFLVWGWLQPCAPLGRRGGRSVWVFSSQRVLRFVKLLCPSEAGLRGHALFHGLRPRSAGFTQGYNAAPVGAKWRNVGLGVSLAAGAPPKIGFYRGIVIPGPKPAEEPVRGVFGLGRVWSRTGVGLLHCWLSGRSRERDRVGLSLSPHSCGAGGK
jgi:hypothetical protein